MSVRNWKRAVVWFLMLSALVLLCCTGCKKKEQDTFSELYLQEGSEDEVKSETEEKPEAERAPEAEEIWKPEGTPKEESVKPEEVQSEPEVIFVHVCGAVVSPGVYGMEPDARVYEAVSCAGGLREDAAGEAVNQAQKVTDGERIYIPTREEADAGWTSNMETDPTSEGGSTSENNGVQTGNTEEKVNINTASLEELRTLSGIGDTRAKSILDYREAQGGFQTIEELMNVEGIKEGVFEKIKDRITVNTGS